MSLKELPDRGRILTEQRNPRSARLHELSIDDCVALMQREDRAILTALAAARPALTAFIRVAAARFRDVAPAGGGGRLIYLGAGTSGRLGVLDASEAPPTFCVEPGRIVGIIAGGESALRRSSEGKEDDADGAEEALREIELGPTDTVLGIAAGGTTPYVLGGLARARRIAGPKVLTGLLTCSQVPRPSGVGHLIVLPTGAEVLTGSTRLKAGTATKMALNTISTTLMVVRGRVYQNLMVDVRATNDKLIDRAARIISTITGLSRSNALVTLQQAEGRVKHAIVMTARGVDLAQADKLLLLASGNLSEVLIPAPSLARPPARSSARRRKA
ncbi:MAG: N-acetylmuramic acid 6-phosphate etherase [Phycisphaerales bacterium]